MEESGFMARLFYFFFGAIWFLTQKFKPDLFKYIIFFKRHRLYSCTKIFDYGNGRSLI